MRRLKCINSNDILCSSNFKFDKHNFQNNNSGGGGGGSMSRRRSRALVVKSASAPAISRDPGLPFMFQKFNVSLPAQLTARVTERIDYDTYLMRNQEVLDNLEKVSFSFFLNS